MNAATLLTEISKIPLEDRVSLVHQIWDQIADSNAILPFSESQKAELDRRRAELESDPDSAIPWEDVKRRLQERSQQ